ncbi:hypothetical protein BDF22DRAFT_740530 [Syncephalis plumigaleata]|nr:hypothetical protein BDF22DRAFT_740530 [Syncephalis plumigaleata]
MTMTKKKSHAQPASNNDKSTHPELFRVEHGTDGNFTSRLVACKDYPSGSLIVKLDKKILVPVAHPVYTTVQTGEQSHYMGLTAARDIASGEEMTFFYPSTEWNMDQPFDCWCGADKLLAKQAGTPELLKIL